jgi:hypothetical protein
MRLRVIIASQLRYFETKVYPFPVVDWRIDEHENSRTRSRPVLRAVRVWN